MQECIAGAAVYFFAVFLLSTNRTRLLTGLAWCIERRSSETELVYAPRGSYFTAANLGPNRSLWVV